jgi:hypothetical protein
MVKPIPDRSHLIHINMSERVEHQPVPGRLVCPNCLADFPAPFSRREITCRRCGSAFVAPDEARDGTSGRCDWRSDGSEKRTGTEHGDVRNDRGGDRGGRIRRALRTVEGNAATVALCFNAAAFCFWLAGVASFEIAAMTMLLVMNGFVVQQRR